MTDNPMDNARPEGPVIGPIGLDVGYDALRCVRVDGDRLIVQRQSAGYAIVPGGDARRRLLSAAGIAYTPCGDDLLVIGDAAREVSESFGVPVVPAFPNAEMPPDDPVGRQVVGILVESTVGKGSGICGLSLPGNVDEDNELVRFVGNLVTLAGFRPLLAHSAAAAGLVLHEATALTGLTIDFGAARVGMSLLARGRETWHQSLDRGSASILEGVAEAGKMLFYDREGHGYRDLMAARAWVADPDRPGDRASAASRKLSEDVNLLLDEVCGMLGDVTEAARLGRVPSPLPVALTGGFANLPGMTGRFSDRLRRVDPEGHLTPLANDPRDGLTVARGLLLLADLETPLGRAAA